MLYIPVLYNSHMSPLSRNFCNNVKTTPKQFVVFLKLANPRPQMAAILKNIKPITTIIFTQLFKMSQL